MMKWIVLAIISFGMVCSEHLVVELIGSVLFILSLNEAGKEIESGRG